MATTEGSASRRPVRPLDMRINRFGDVVVSARDLGDEPAEFEKRLIVSLENWRRHDRPGAWLTIPLARSDLVPTAVRQGFVPHHCTETYFMLTHWIPKSPSKIPSIGTNNVGVSVLVPRFVRGRGVEIILVREKYSKRRRSWKVVSGGVEIGELFAEAALRELREEVGVVGEFVCAVGLWNRKNTKFRRGEIHIACVVRPTGYVRSRRRRRANGSDGPQAFHIQRDEITAARWTDMSEAVRIAARDPRNIERHWYSSMISCLFRTPSIDAFDAKRRSGGGAKKAAISTPALTRIDTHDVRGPPQRMHFHVSAWNPGLFAAFGNDADGPKAMQRWMQEAPEQPWYEEWCTEPDGELSCPMLNNGNDERGDREQFEPDGAPSAEDHFRRERRSQGLETAEPVA